MEAWPGIITEWVNCLEVLEVPIKELNELEDGEFYKKLLRIIAWHSEKNVSDEKNILVHFLKEEYPEFKIDNECGERQKNHMYIASLFLLYTSQNQMFHLPMCSKLSAQTQTKIKTFLENLIPYGVHITSERLKHAISELGCTIPNTPMTPRTRGLRDFFNSPAVHSAQSHKMLAERNRELRKLRNDLEAERFERSELEQDLEIYKKKLLKMQHALHERTLELKAVRDEYLTPATPQSCKKEKPNTKQESFYKKEVDRLENQLMEKQLELETSEENNQKLKKQLTFVEKQCHILKEKVEGGERCIEDLQIQAEVKDNEIAVLKTTVEDLRTCVKELTKSNSEEESFDLSGVRPLYSSTSSLNTSEALSTVIELQLHEAREEANLLKGQVETLNKTIDTITEEHKRVVELNARLENDVSLLPQVEAKLENALNKISSTNEEIQALKTHQAELVQQKDELDRLLKTQEQECCDVVRAREELRLELGELKETRAELEKTLVQETNRAKVLDTTLRETRIELDECRASIQRLETDNESLKSYIETCKINLKSIRHVLSNIAPENNNVDEFVNVELKECIKIILNDVSREHAAKEKEILALNSTISESNVNLRNLEADLSKLQRVHALGEAEVSNLTKTIQENNIVINNLSVSKEQLVAREQKLLEEMNKSRTDYENRLAVLISDCRTFEQKLQENQMCTESLETQLADSQKEIQQIINTRIGLENQLSECQRGKDDLAMKLTEMKKEKDELSEKAAKLFASLEEERKRHEKNLQERISDSESLKSENIRLTTQLQSSNEKHELIQRELSGVKDELKLKNDRIEKLVGDLSLLKVEKEHFSSLQAKVESNMKAFVEHLKLQILEKQGAYDQLSMQIKLKDDTIESLHKEKSEWHASELKMKEVLMNLQEVRATQEAVLQTQEKALNEKSLLLAERQAEFELCKASLNQQIDHEKSRNSELQHQSEKRVKMVEELEEALKKEREDKESLRESCQNEVAKKLEIVKACEVLGDLVDDLKFTIKGATQDVDDIYENTKKIGFTECDDKLKNILNIMQSAINEMHASRKLISHLYNSNTGLRQALNGHEDLVEKHNKTLKEAGILRAKVSELEICDEKRVKHLRNLMKRKKYLTASLQPMQTAREDLDVALTNLEQKWEEIAVRFANIFTTNGCLCDELKSIQAKKGDFENILRKYNSRHLTNLRTLNSLLWEKFTWIEDQMQNSEHHIGDVDLPEKAVEDSFASEKHAIDSGLEKNERLRKDIARMEQELEEFSNRVSAFKIHYEAGEIYSESESEKKLKVQISELMEEKDNLKSKLNTLRVVNVRLDDETEALKSKLKELKSETVPLTEAEDLKKDLKNMKDECRKLREEIEELNKRPKQEYLDRRVKEINDKYEAKVDEMKQKMKASYNEQVAKLHKDQENCIRERLETLQGKMEQQCRKQAIEINKYKAHVSELSSQLWTVGEKLLIEKQQKQEMEKELNELKAKYHNLKLQLSQQAGLVVDQKAIKTEKRDFAAGDNVDQVFQKISTVREKTTFERRCSIQSLRAIGNAFNAEDEEGEVFDNIYLADIKDNQQSSFALDPERMSVLKMRNSMCKPHLKSSYPAEMQFHPLPFTEEEIKSGPVEENFNDSLSQSLLPEQKTKKKDKTQTTYRKPGPPTPSKNGGRLSLQGNELRSPNSKVLRERNKDRTTSTPRTIRSIFGSSRRQDENVLSTPKERRRSSIFRKSRVTTNR